LQYIRRFQVSATHEKNSERFEYLLLSIVTLGGLLEKITCSNIGDLGRTFDNINSVASLGKSDGNGEASNAGTNNDDMLLFL
jgi:hypothetical protein